MNPNHLKFICTELQLGSPDDVVTSIHGSRGGSFIWRVNTKKGRYAIKQLAPDIDLKSERIVTKYELSETIAYRFAKHGIPAVYAIEKSGKRLIIIENIGYLVYPWIDGYTLGRSEISQSHALKIAEIIATLHKINMNVPEIKAPHVDIHPGDRIVEAIDRAASFEFPFAKTLKENQNFILSMNDSYLAVIPTLLEDTVITHGDLDQLNVLWDESDQPILIDWESARKMNPTRDIVRTSMSWSGGGTALPIYNHMLQAYKKSGGILNKNHVNAALYSLVGTMVNWMLYNIKIACTNDAPAKDTAIEEANGALTMMKKLKILIPKLLRYE